MWPGRGGGFDTTSSRPEGTLYSYFLVHDQDQKFWFQVPYARVQNEQDSTALFDSIQTAWLSSLPGYVTHQKIEFQPEYLSKQGQYGSRPLAYFDGATGVQWKEAPVLSQAEARENQDRELQPQDEEATPAEIQVRAERERMLAASSKVGAVVHDFSATPAAFKILQPTQKAEEAQVPRSLEANSVASQNP